jgi:hypothetical protein
MGGVGRPNPIAPAEMAVNPVAAKKSRRVSAVPVVGSFGLGMSCLLIRLIGFLKGRVAFAAPTCRALFGLGNIQVGQRSLPPRPEVLSYLPFIITIFADGAKESIPKIWNCIP